MNRSERDHKYSQVELLRATLEGLHDKLFCLEVPGHPDQDEMNALDALLEEKVEDLGLELLRLDPMRLVGDDPGLKERLRK